MSDQQATQDDSLKLLEEALSKDPQDLGALGAKAEILMNKCKYDKALESLEKATTYHPMDTFMWCLKGLALGKLDRTNEALEAYKKASELFGTDGAGTIPDSATNSFGYWYMWLKGTINYAIELKELYEEANAEMKKLDQTNPKVQKAAEKLQKLIQESDKVIKNLVKAGGNVKANVFKDICQTGQLKEEFIEHHEERIKMLDKPVAYKPRLAALYMNKVYICLNKGNSDNTLELLEKVLSIDPENLEALEAKARNLLKKAEDLDELGKPNEALDAYKKAGQLFLDSAKYNMDSTKSSYWEIVVNNTIEIKRLFIRAEAEIRSLNGAPKVEKEVESLENLMHEADMFFYNFTNEADYIEADYTEADIQKFIVEIEGLKDKLKKQFEYVSAVRQVMRQVETLEADAKTFMTQRKYNEALENFEKVLTYHPRDTFMWCQKGLALDKLGRPSEALEAFTKASELFSNDAESRVDTTKSKNWLEIAVNYAIELKELSEEANAELKGLDKTNLTVQRAARKFQKMTQEAERVTESLINEADKLKAGMQETKRLEDQLKFMYPELALMIEADKLAVDMQKYIVEAEDLKSQFRKDLEHISVLRQFNNLDSQVKTLAHNFEELKAELSTKMDDFRKKLEFALSKTDMNPDEVTSIKEYFNAFIETFSSLYVTSQVIESGQVQLDSSNHVTSILSFAASFAPFFGDALSSGITSIGEFLKTKEMRTNARKMLLLANDPSDLSQLVGRVVYDVIMKNPKKQTQIIEITSKDLDIKLDRLFTKILALCDKITEKKDAYLYGKLYKTAAAKLGHINANALIEYWIREDLSPFGIEEKFIEILIADIDKKESQSTASKVPETSMPETSMPETSMTARGNGVSTCCSMF